jgi:DNA-binding MarR family transcriptional regulator
MSNLPQPADFYHRDSYAAEASVGFLMKRVLTLLGQAVDKRLAPCGLTHAQWIPLYKIAQGEATTVAELARHAQMDAGAMTRMLDRLEAKGLCRRVRGAQDRRVVQLELTPEGRAIAAEVPAVLSDVMNALLAGFSRDEWLQLKDFLHRMLANGEAWRDAS